MESSSKSIVRGVITLTLITTFVVLARSTETVWSHGLMDVDEYHSAIKKKNKRGPHGGPVAEFRKNYLEFVVNPEIGKIALFLLDKDLEVVPVPEDYSGAGYLKMANNSIKWFNLTRVDQGSVSHFIAETGIKDLGSFNAVISLKTASERENFRFSWAPEASTHN